jgi:hypothetical protein
LQFFNLPECCIDGDGKKQGKGVLGKLKSIFGKKP